MASGSSPAPVRPLCRNSSSFFIIASRSRAPAAAFLVLVPIAVDLEFGIAWAREAAYVCGWLVAMGCLAVSAVPTFAGKGVKLPVGAVLPVMAGGSILIAGVFMQPWITYMALALVYVSTIPLSILRFYRHSSPD